MVLVSVNGIEPADRMFGTSTVLRISASIYHTCVTGWTFWPTCLANMLM
jgi:hypothetical protein